MEIGSVQKKIAGVMFLVLVASISLITYTTAKNKPKVFPPVVNQCPDFFSFSDTKCIHNPSIYPNAPDIDLSESDYVSTNAKSQCKQKSWAKQNGVTWDGITNNEAIIPC